jgi:hypothetical protein
MNTRKSTASWLAATLIAAVAVAAAPHLFGGGGDEGVDILPLMGTAKLASPTPPPPPSSVTTLDVGCVRVHLVPGFTMDELADWRRSGVLVGPQDFGQTAGAGGAFSGLQTGNRPEAEVFPAGKKHLSFARLDSDVHVDGKFELIDVDPSDGHPVTLVGRVGTQSMAVLLIGERGTHLGPIPSSFTRIDRVVVGAAMNGIIDLREVRERLVHRLAGTAVDVAVGIIVPDPAGAVNAWAAFNVDDQYAVFDIDAKGL